MLCAPDNMDSKLIRKKYKRNSKAPKVTEDGAVAPAAKAKRGRPKKKAHWKQAKSTSDKKHSAQPKASQPLSASTEQPEQVLTKPTINLKDHAPVTARSASSRPKRKAAPREMFVAEPSKGPRDYSNMKSSWTNIKHEIKSLRTDPHP